VYSNKYGIKQYQNRQSPLNGVFILPCETQHTYTSYGQRRFCHVSLNVLIAVLNS